LAFRFVFMLIIAKTPSSVYESAVLKRFDSGKAVEYDKQRVFLYFKGHRKPTLFVSILLHVIIVADCRECDKFQTLMRTFMFFVYTFICAAVCFHLLSFPLLHTPFLLSPSSSPPPQSRPLHYHSPRFSYPTFVFFNSIFSSCKPSLLLL